MQTQHLDTYSFYYFLNEALIVKIGYEQYLIYPSPPLIETNPSVRVKKFVFNGPLVSKVLDGLTPCCFLEKLKPCYGKKLSWRCELEIHLSFDISISNIESSFNIWRFIFIVKQLGQFDFLWYNTFISLIYNFS